MPATAGEMSSLMAKLLLLQKIFLYEIEAIGLSENLLTATIVEYQIRLLQRTGARKCILSVFEGK